MTTLHILFILLSLLLLTGGAEGLVRGSAALARRAGISPLAVGLTIVAFGTSSPELVVSVQASLCGHGDIAAGNVLGSNAFNVGVILGLTALLGAIPVHRQILRLDAPLALAAALLLPLLLFDGVLSRFEAAFLALSLTAYICICLRTARQNVTTPATPPIPDAQPVQSARPWPLDLLMTLAGLALLVAGSNLLIEHSVLLAKTLGISDAVIGLTIVAAGTSMPELATSLVAAFRKQPDIAIGNVVGSNLFNILGILGAAGLAAPLHVAGIAALDYAFVIGFSLILLPFFRTGRRLSRAEGGVLLAAYGFYLFLRWPGG